MGDPETSAANVRAALTFLGGLLAFTAAVAALVDRRLQTASPEAKGRFLAGARTWVEILLWISGTVALVAFNSPKASIYLYLPALLVQVVDFLKGSPDHLRRDTLRLVVSASFLVLIVGMHSFTVLLGLLQKLVR